MNVLVLGCGPLPSPTHNFCSFGQLRTWSILKTLQQTEHHIEHILLGLDDSSGLLPYSNTTIQQITQAATQADIVITTGPFLPALVLDAIPANKPLWLDWPSDPLADQQAKRSQVKANPREESLVQEIVQRALHRADAISVISERQKWATIGQLLLLGREDVPVVTVPIAFDFPNKIKAPRKKSKNILLSGSLNTWLHIDKILHSISTESDLHLHITGGATHHFIEMKERLEKLLIDYPHSVTHHGWLNEDALQKVISKCYFATWLDLDGLEPLLGSRTRALFYIWNGLKIFGSTMTELGQQLHQEGYMAEWHQRYELSAVIANAEQIDVAKAQRFCMRYFAPDAVYQPLLKWTNHPRMISAGRPSFIAEENQQLRREIQSIYNSKTWKWSNRLHLLLRSARNRID